MRAVTPSLSNPYKTWIFNKKVLKPVANLKLKEFYNAPRQILPRTFWQVGNFDFLRINYKINLLCQRKNLTSSIWDSWMPGSN